jgi:hypothetical protein
MQTRALVFYALVVVLVVWIATVGFFGGSLEERNETDSS